MEYLDMGWNIGVLLGGGDNDPFGRTFGEPADEILNENPYFLWPWLLCILQGPCAVDCVVGPVLVNAADCLVTASGCCYPGCVGACFKCCWCSSDADDAFKEFDRLHWSLWKCSPLRACCCSDVKPLDDEEWKRNTYSYTFFGCRGC